MLTLGLKCKYSEKVKFLSKKSVNLTLVYKKRFLNGHWEIIFLDYNVGRFDCSSSPNTCTDLYIFKKPAFILFKRDGHYEFYYGKISPCLYNWIN